MKTIIGLYRILFLTVSLLWFKCLWDIAHAHEVFRNAAFPGWFNVLFFLAGIATIPLYGCCTTNIKTPIPQWSTKDFWLWLSVPLALICVSPVCYKGIILIAAYPISTVLRWMLLIVPLALSVLYYKKQYSKSILLLLIVGFIALLPNDACNNQFNYWYVKRIGYSPLTYVPVVMNILFVTASYLGKNKNVLLLLSLGVCIGSLIISFGHRLDILW